MRFHIASLAVVLTTIMPCIPAHTAVEIYQVHAGEQVPAWVCYTLNCQADVTLEVFRADGGSPVNSATFPGQPRGKHQYLWTGLAYNGTPAAEGSYYARITAVSTQTQWDTIIGLFKNDDWTHEHPPRPLPACPNSEGFYGIGINRNPNSAYYGRIYVSHKVQKHVFMYDPDGEFLGQMDDSAVSWGVSAPWDVAIAEDDYVYVDDRSNRVVHCFTPDGRHVSASPAMNYSKALFARTDTEGVTHVFQTGGPTIRKITLAADHATWGAPCNSYTPGTNNLATLGIWVSPDLAAIYNCYSEDAGTDNPGLTRWQGSDDCLYIRDSWASSVANPVSDVDMALDGTCLWVTRMAEVAGGGAIGKVSISNGAPHDPPDADYDVVSYALMCCTDGVGNVGVTFGKATSTWAQYYWGVFAEPGTTQAQKTSTQFTLTAHELSTIRAMPAGATVEVFGTVTGKWADFFYIEDTDRQVGVRVQSSLETATVGSRVKIVGTLGFDDGERVIAPSVPPILLTGNSVCAPYDLRTRDIGGAAYAPAHPGVADGRGALNVGLLVHVQGMVTARDPGGQWFSVWDGSNASDQPVSDGVGHLGVRVESSLACKPWVDWVEVTGVVSTDASSVPGRVIPLVLATSAVRAASFDTISSPAGAALACGWNLFALPAAPAGAGDTFEYSAKPWEAFQVLSPSGDPNDIAGRLYRWENCSGGLCAWDPWSEVGACGPFGGLVLGDGYWLNLDEDGPVSYSARASNLDQWISICSPGWMIIGHPKSHGTALADVMVHDGGTIRSMHDAVLTDDWIECTGYWWDNENQGVMDIGIPDCWASTDTLMPWRGYWMRSFRGGLALIVPED